MLPGEPLADLAVRIDREADFWRAFAIRSLRPGGPRNVAIAAAAIGVGAAVVLGVVGAFGALLGIESAGVDLLETALALASRTTANGLVSCRAAFAFFPDFSGGPSGGGGTLLGVSKLTVS